MTRSGGRRTSAPRTGAYPGYVLQNVYAWLRRHPWQADSALAVVLLALSADQVPAGPANVVFAAIMVNVLLAATVIPRRRYPVAAFAAAAAIGAAQVAFGLQVGASAPAVALQPSATDLAIVVLLYTLAACRPRRISIAALTICLLGSAIAIARWTPAHTAHPGTPLFAAVIGLGGLALIAWVLGDSVAYRYRHAYYASLEDRAARLEAERDAQARIAAAAERSRELQEQRARAVDESAARLRRIERDLHDGAQVRLTALAMSLGEIKENLEAAAGREDDGGRTRMLAGAAHRSAKETLAELRDLARGIHPPVLDRGLGAALSNLAEASATPAGLTVTIGERPSPAIEAIAYFCAAELLANVAKHSGADRATISVSVSVSDGDGDGDGDGGGGAGGGGGGLLMTVADDGAGGARLAPGGGLAGLLERVQTVDGRLGIDSPPGGPTIITIRLPGHA
jgi:signal transduction histidine kinase